MKLVWKSGGVRLIIRENRATNCAPTTGDRFTTIYCRKSDDKKSQQTKRDDGHPDALILEAIVSFFSGRGTWAKMHQLRKMCQNEEDLTKCI